MDLFLPEKDSVFFIPSPTGLSWPALDWLHGLFDVKLSHATRETPIDLQAIESGAKLLVIDASGSLEKAAIQCHQLRVSPPLHFMQIVALLDEAKLDSEARLLSAGATEVISPPTDQERFQLRMHARMAFQNRLEINKMLEDLLQHEVQRRIEEITTTQDVAILALTSLAEKRDNETGNHIRRTQRYVKALALRLRQLEKHAEELTDQRIELLFKSAPLHDIGKVGIPDRILLKPGKLTPEEFEIMKTHTTLGRDAIQNAEDMLGAPAEFLQIAKEIAYSHQEKWDGSGYPLGLKGEAIPLSARLMALADVYDALINRRVYKPKFTHDDAVAIIVEGRAKHFDPDVVDAFLDLIEEFQAIASEFADTEEDLVHQYNERPM